MFISIGPNCHPAGNLRFLKLRNISLPFDWLSIEKARVFEYINDLIGTNFLNFTHDLSYNVRGKVVSKHYDYVEFFHYDLIANEHINRVEDEGKNLIEMMNRRGQRFMEIISDKNSDVNFVCMLHYTIINGNNNLYNDMKKFDDNVNIKCKYKILVYLYNDNDDFELIIPNELLLLKHFIFDKYIKDQKVSSIYGNKKDFEKMLKRNKLL